MFSKKKKVEEMEKEEAPDLVIPQTLQKKSSVGMIPVEKAIDEDEVERLQKELDLAREKRAKELEEARKESAQVHQVQEPKEEEHIIRILEGRLTESGYIYTIISNKSIGEVGEYLNP